MDNIVRRHYVRSDHAHYWHVAIVKRHNRVLAVGVNTGWNHAEQDAIGSVKNRRLLIGATIYSYRVGKNGHLRNARPCWECDMLIRSVGIKRVIYSDANGYEQEYEVEKN